MDVARPYAALTGGSLEGEVLAVLAGTAAPMTGRQIGRLASRGSVRGVRLALQRLAEHGLVDVVDAPPAHLYSLNREHVAAPVALALVDLREELFRRLRDAVDAWSLAAAHVSVFGSAARGDGDTESDIDLFVVREADVDPDDPRWRAQLDGLADHVRRWTGNHAGISEVGADDLAAMRQERPDVLAELERDAVTLAGLRPEVLLAPMEIRS